MSHFHFQVVAEKQLLKHLQQEVVRLEAELQNPEPSGSLSLRSLLVEKELKIQQVEMGGKGFPYKIFTSIKYVAKYFCAKVEGPVLLVFHVIWWKWKL